MLAASAAVSNSNCEDTRCLRFYNAECRDDHCNNISCTPNFFFRGRNVTEKCDVETCDERECPERRQCVEEIIPPVCPIDRPMCRQYLRSKCILTTSNRLMSCSDIKCDPGKVCRFRERPGFPPVVRCVSMEKQTSCTNTHCNDGFTCKEEGSEIQCISDPTSPVSTTTLKQENQATPLVTIGSGGMPSGSGSGESCKDILCPEDQHCIMSLTSDFRGCVPVHMNVTCAELSCPQEAPTCNLATYPSFNNCTIASCITPDQVELYMESRHTSSGSCKQQREMCERNGLTCVDLCQGGIIPAGIDCTLFNCIENPCPKKHKCDDVPDGLAECIKARTICIPDHVDIDFNVTCASDQAPHCGPGMTCTQYKIGNIVVGSYCEQGIIPHLPCSERTCSEEREVCTENSFQSVELHSLCTNTDAVLYKFAFLGQESCSTAATDDDSDMA